MTEKVAWYARKYKGPPLQSLWQVAVGASVFIAFVGYPLTRNIIRSQKMEKAKLAGIVSNPIQQKVYNQRLALRSSLAKD